MTSSSPIGFEGFEKRLEIAFAPAPLFTDPSGLGLRRLTRPQIDSILEPACCTIVSQLSNSEFDSYVLSESSLFIYPLRIILKTCGTTKLLSSIPQILGLAESLSLGVLSVKYSRGSFIFPDAQPVPYRNFADEVDILNGSFGHLNSAAYMISDPNNHSRKWHVYRAVSKRVAGNDPTAEITLEMCMTGLDKEKAAVFYKSPQVKMTKASGISSIIPSHVICDYEFEPCGYSMNGIEDTVLSTIHVTPEDGYSYASYEAMGFKPESVNFNEIMNRVIECFSPAEFSVAVTYPGGDCKWESESEVEGYSSMATVRQVLPGGAVLMYRTCTKNPGKEAKQWREGPTGVEKETEEKCAPVAAAPAKTHLVPQTA
ncbi:hypothetical protein MLD38_007190 [Melastoma candidum]|uniref:Uncharacterized protein n=1 Tax=Melastoma candidum TaxID=119954 RepID=A0ACB9RPL2_9MYRT|nr:hypothetical protein MLD38_007190 [Melastoma candidum]